MLCCSHEDVFVFIIGGVTYEEALFVHHLNASRSGLKIVLGGSCIHNSDSYVCVCVCVCVCAEFAYRRSLNKCLITHFITADDVLDLCRAQRISSALWRAPLSSSR